MKTLLTLLIALLVNGCGSANHVEPVTQYTHSELIANCTEDFMDNATYPDDMDDMDAIDYIADKAIEHCEAKYAN